MAGSEIYSGIAEAMNSMTFDLALDEILIAVSGVLPEARFAVGGGNRHALSAVSSLVHRCARHNKDATLAASLQSGTRFRFADN